MSKKRKSGPSYAERIAEPFVVVFGTQRIGAIYGLRNNLNPEQIVLATAGADGFRGRHGSVTVVRVRDDIWKAPTFACEKRCAETEATLKALEEAGVEVNTVWMD
jgi:hypothetical protein